MSVFPINAMSRVDNLEVKVQPALQIFTQQLIKVKLKWKNAFLTLLDHIFSHALRLFSNICQIKNPFLCILISKSNISPKHFGCGPAGYFEESGIYESSRLCRRHFTLDSFSVQWDRSLYPVGVHRRYTHSNQIPPNVMSHLPIL